MLNVEKLKTIPTSESLKIVRKKISNLSVIDVLPRNCLQKVLVKSINNQKKKKEKKREPLI